MLSLSLSLLLLLLFLLSARRESGMNFLKLVTFEKEEEEVERGLVERRGGVPALAAAPKGKGELVNALEMEEMEDERAEAGEDKRGKEGVEDGMLARASLYLWMISLFSSLFTPFNSKMFFNSFSEPVGMKLRYLFQSNTI